ncbi:uncharacterized protein F5Z01DRAFT_671935 [Emericellopsis atlantica]|uniref:Uncharacterized protein n=1 Tax=Emericellopsis atlantica TaxID=2614577 RepID=A0A9P8CRU1_9HYPO|nr:uncharacterized protein F5Z01DRAFT_671935 [Emericellopsis atlantica]KAG9256692.1 hypothetical protein F5Z01DRAFT_671935 [Emericellopsis atlantica]
MPGFVLQQLIASMTAVNGDETNVLNKRYNDLLALAPLIQEVLDPNSDMTQDIRDELRSHINELLRELDADADGDAAVVASTGGPATLRTWRNAGWADQIVDMANDAVIKEGKLKATLARVAKLVIFLCALELYIDKVHDILVPFLAPPPPKLTYTAIPRTPTHGTVTAIEIERT